MNSDPIADMLTRIRNGCRARLDRVDVPKSKFKVELAQVLKTEGYIQDFQVVPDKLQGTIEISLRYDDGRRPAISGLRRISTSGLRQYMRCAKIPKIRRGMGVVILTTSKGLMTDREARQAKLGGEAICAVW